MKRSSQATGPGWELHRGPYQRALSHVDMVDTLIVDAPYSERTHRGHDDGVTVAHLRPGREARMRVDRRNGSVYSVRKNRRKPLSYRAWTPSDVRKFVASWAPRTRGWFVSLTDHVLAPHWEAALARAGRYTFSPLSFLAPGSRVRLTGDGPAQWACWIIVARPSDEQFFHWGALPGGYVLPPGANDRCNDRESITGGKPLWLMRALVRDYSRPGDLVCDPCAGGGTTLLAALMEGRRAVGGEKLAENFELARKRLSRGFTPPLIREERGPKPEQLALDGGAA